MPQIWLDYDELSAFLDADASDVRRHVIEQGWARMKSSSGVTRVRLPARLNAPYLAGQMPAAGAGEPGEHQHWAGLREALMALLPGAAARLGGSDTGLATELPLRHGNHRVALLAKSLAGRDAA